MTVEVLLLCGAKISGEGIRRVAGAYNGRAVESECCDPGRTDQKKSVPPNPGYIESGRECANDATTPTKTIIITAVGEESGCARNGTALWLLRRGRCLMAIKTIYPLIVSTTTGATRWTTAVG